MPDDLGLPPDSVSRFVVISEAARALSSSQVEADPARLAAGWTRRFIIEAARAPDMMRLYEELGYEVCADPVRGDTVSDDCADCRLVIAFDFRMIYTRPKTR